MRHISDQVAVLYLGKIMELTDSDELYRTGRLHPYTQALISAAPIPNPSVDRARERILCWRGRFPAPSTRRRGADSVPGCKYADERCCAEEPPLVDVGNEHLVACHRVAGG